MPLRPAQAISPYFGEASSWMHQQLLALQSEEPLVLTEFPMQGPLPESIPCYAFPPPMGSGFVGKTLRRGMGKLWGNRRFAKAMARHGSRILHAHYGPYAWRSLPWAEEAGIPLVASFYGMDLECQLRKDPAWRERYLELFDRGSLFLAEGPAMRSALERMGCPPGKIRIHRLGMPVRDLPFKARLPESPFRLLSAASLMPKKGHDDVLKALALLPRGRFRLTLLGNGPLLGELRELAERLRISKEVSFRSAVPHSALSAVLAEHHLLLHPSKPAPDGETEGGAPLILVEALASGLPVIATQHADIPEVVADGECGLLVPEAAPGALADAVRTLSSDPDRMQAFARNGRARMERLHDREARGTALVALYREVLSSRRQPVLRHILLNGMRPDEDPRVSRAMEAGVQEGFEVSCLPLHPLELHVRQHDAVRAPLPDAHHPLRRLWHRLRRRSGTRLTPSSPLRLLPRPFRQMLRDAFRVVELCVPGLAGAWACRRSRKADLYHAHDLDGLVAGALLAWRHRARLVYDAHEYPRDEVHGHTAVFRTGVSLLEALLVPRADAVVTVSPWLSRRMARDLRIPAPIVVRNVSSKIPEVCPPLTPDLWYYGMFQTGRGIEPLVEGLARVPEARLRMQGLGILEGFLQERAGRPELRGRLLLVPPQLPHLAARTPAGEIGVDPLVSDSLQNHAALTNKLLLYLHAGLVVLSADLPAVREEVGGWPGVFRCRFDTPEQVADGIRRVLALSPGERRELGRDNRERAIRNLSWEAERERLGGLYRRLLS